MPNTIQLDAAAFLQHDAYTERTAGQRIDANGNVTDNGRYEVLYTSRDVNGQSFGQTSGYYGAAYRDTQTGLVWFSHQGTNFSDLNGDAASLLPVAIAKLPLQAPDALAFVAAAKNEIGKLPDYAEHAPNYAYTGHSQGAALAILTGNGSHELVIAMNPIGIGTAYSNGLPVFPEGGDYSNVFILNSYGDPALLLGQGNIGTRFGFGVNSIPLVPDGAEPYLIIGAVLLGGVGGALVTGRYLLSQHSNDNAWDLTKGASIIVEGDNTRLVCPDCSSVTIKSIANGYFTYQMRDDVTGQNVGEFSVLANPTITTANGWKVTDYGNGVVHNELTSPTNAVYGFNETWTIGDSHGILYKMEISNPNGIGNTDTDYVRKLTEYNNGALVKQTFLYVREDGLESVITTNENNVENAYLQQTIHGKTLTDIAWERKISVADLQAMNPHIIDANATLNGESVVVSMDISNIHISGTIIDSRISSVNDKISIGLITNSPTGEVSMFNTFDLATGKRISTTRAIADGETSTEITIDNDGTVTKTVINLANSSTITKEIQNIKPISSGEATKLVVSDVASFITSLRTGDEVTQIISAARLVYDIAAINQIQGLDALGNSAYGAGSIVGIIGAIKGLQSENVLTQISSATSLLSNASTLYDVLDGGYTFNSPNGFLDSGSIKLLSQVGAIISVANLATNLDDLLENGQVIPAINSVVSTYQSVAFAFSWASYNPYVFAITTIISLFGGSLFGGDEEEPPPAPPVGEATFIHDANGNLSYHISNPFAGKEAYIDYGLGYNILRNMLEGPDGLLAKLNSQLSAANTGNTDPDRALTLIASRMPKITIQSWMIDSESDNGKDNYFYILETKDPRTGEKQLNALANEDIVRHFAETLIYPEAIAQQWEVNHLQAKFGVDEANWKTEGQWSSARSTIEQGRSPLEEAVEQAKQLLELAKTNDLTITDTWQTTGLQGNVKQTPATELAAAKAAKEAAIAQAQTTLDNAQQALDLYNVQHPSDPQLAARIVDENALPHIDSTSSKEAIADYIIQRQVATEGASHQWLKVIALDLSTAGDGISQRILPNSVKQDLRSIQTDGVARFDVDNDGYREATQWINPTDAVLGLDRDGNGRIDSANELFNGINTPFDQRGAASLQYYDDNNDGKLNAQDKVFKLLRLWIDLDGDGSAGDLEVFNMDMRLSGDGAATLIAAMNASGLAALDALAQQAVQSINLSTLQFQLKDGTTNQGSEVQLKSEVEGITLLVDDATQNISILHENAPRENYITLVADMEALLEWTNPNLTAARKNELKNIANKYGLNTDSPEFMTVVRNLRVGGENIGGSGLPVYISSGDVFVDNNARQRIEAMRFSFQAVVDARSADIANVAYLGQQSWVQSNREALGFDDGWNAAHGAVVVSDSPTPETPKPPRSERWVLPSDVYSLDYVVKGLQLGGLIVQKAVLASNADQPTAPKQLVQVFTTAKPNGTLATATLQGEEDGQFSFGFAQLEQEAKTLIAGSTPYTIVKLLGVRDATHGTIVIDDASGTINFIADENYSGTAAGFSYVVADDQGRILVRRINFNLVEINDAPTVLGEHISAKEDVPLTIDVAALLANDSDLEHDSLSIIGIGRVGMGKAELLANGKIYYTPPSDLYGTTDTVEYIVQDARGGSAIGVIKITLEAVNDAPTVVSEIIRNAQEDTNLRIDPSLLLANDFDPDFNFLAGAEPLHITAVGNAQHGHVFLDASGHIIFVPDEDFNGIAKFEYTVADITGLETTGIAEVDINAVNDAPLAFGETIHSAEDQKLVIDPHLLLVNDTDADILRGEQQTLNIIAVDEAQHGSVAIKNGNVIFTPDENYHGDASFRYTVGDGNSGFAQATVHLDISAVNDAPQAINRAFIGSEDTAITITYAQLLAGIVDIDNSTTESHVSNVQNALGGTLTQNSNGITFTPKANMFGTAQFQYSVSDAQGASTTATAFVDFNNVNDAPVFVAGSHFVKTGEEDQEVRISGSALLNMFADADKLAGDTLAIDLPSLSTVNSADTIRYDATTQEIVFKAAANANGVREFNLRAVDKAGALSNTVTLQVDIRALNDAPIVKAGGFQVLEDGGYTDPTKSAVSYLYHNLLLQNASDVDGDTLSIISVSNGKTADGRSVTVVNDNTQGRIAIQTPLNYNGAISFEFKVNDGHGGTTSQTAYGNVVAVNDTPQITATFLKTFTDSHIAGRGSLVSSDPSREYYRLDVTDVEDDGSKLTPVIDHYPLQSKVAQGVTVGIVYKEVYTDRTHRNFKLVAEEHVINTTANYFGIENQIVRGTTQQESVVFKVTDSQGAVGYQTVTFQAYGVDPIIIDLGNNGLEFISAADSQVLLDRDGDGLKEHVAWVKPTEAILAWDHNHDNKINRTDEIEFASHINPLIDGITDLQVLGLPEFDGNQDGKFDSADSKWSEFKLWQDLNSNGVSDPGELKTLGEAGIKALYLNANVLNRHYGPDVLVRGYTRIEMMDGTFLQAGDVQFNILPSDWVAPDTTPTSSQQQATAASAEENQALLSAQQRQQTASREGDSHFSGALQDQKVLTGETYEYVLPENLFASLGAGALYKLTQASGAPLPSWLHFDNATHTLYGTPTKGQLGTWQIKVSGYQNDGEVNNLTNGGQFSLSVAEFNQAPTAYGTVPVQYANEGSAFSLEIAPNFFIDNDTGDKLSYTLTLANGDPLPSWLNFDARSLRLFGTPDDADVGVLDIIMTAKDSANAVAQSRFELVVEAVNDAPVLHNPVATIQMLIGQANTFSLPQDIFIDTDLADQLSLEVKLTNSAALPDWLIFDATTLRLSATPTQAQLASPLQLQVIATDLSGAKTSTLITLTAAVWGSDANDTLTGSQASETLWGLGGNDTLTGNAGADRLIGGTGDDTYIADNYDTIIENEGEGIDTVQADRNWALVDNLENLILIGTSAINGTGNTLSNLITGNAAANTLNGGAGADTMIGGLGNDIYVVDHAGDTVTETSTLASEIDTIQSSVTYTLASNVENLTLTGSDAINGTGNVLNNTLIGNAANNTIYGGAGNDMLNGGTGADTMIGGTGNDTYVVDSNADVVTETSTLATEIDTVQSSITYTLGSNVENLTLTGVGAINGTGNELNNTLIGNAANNILNGGAGNDAMIGDLGDDIYIVDALTDVITENINAGTDTVQAGITYTLGSNVENLVLTGAIAINGTGNALANTLTGNAANNILAGNAGNDTLDGGIGADTLVGGADNDTYIVDLTSTNTLQDKITEEALGGIDTLQLRGGEALATFTTLTLGTEIDNLDAIGTGSTLLDLTGNELNNVLIGNAASNKLNGGTGADTMIGGAGHDTYTVDNVGDIINEYADEGSDWVNVEITTSAGTYDLAANVENAQLSKTTAYNLSGNALNNLLIGNAAANTLTGGAGNDVLRGLGGSDAMIGGIGDDTYLVDALTDIITENAGEGTDLVEIEITTSGGTYALAANIENAILTNTVAYNLSGNDLNNSLTGNGLNNLLTGAAGNDWLDGGAGNDALVGGTGDDTYVVDNIADIVTELAAQGNDTVLSSISYSLADTDGAGANGGNVENLTLTGFAAINATGNDGNNILTGNSAANTLIGDTGNDTLDGSYGNDILNGGAGDDQYRFNFGGGNDQIIDAGGTDKIIFGTGITAAQITASRANGEVTLTVSNGNSIRFADLGSNTYAVEQFQFADGSVQNAPWVTTLLNTPPSGTDKTITINEDNTHTLSAADFGFTDTNMGDSLSAVRIASLPTAGSLKLNGLTVTVGQEIAAANIVNLVFTPVANANGTNYANFTFSVKDQYGAFDTTPNTLSFNVAAVNDVPTLTTTKATLVNGSEDTVYTITLASLLNGFSDVDGNPLTVTGLTATNGSLSAFNATTQSWTFTPTTNFNGIVNLSYNVTDGIANTAATQSFSLVAVNDAPVLSGTKATLVNGSEDTAYTITLTSLLTGFSDVDGNPLTVTGLTATNGTLSAFNSTSQSWTFTPTANFNGTVNLGYNVTDGIANTAATQSFNVAAVNDAPILTAPVAISYIDTVNDDTFVTKTGNLVAADVDIGTTLSYGISGGTDNGSTVSQVNAYGTLTVTKSSGAYTFIPNDAAIEALKTNSSASFTVIVTDGVIATPVASTLTINLTGANDTAVFAGSLAGSVTEDGTQIATGTLTVTDRDPGDAAITAQTNTLGVYGNFSIASNGQWTYTLNNAAGNVQALKAGQAVNDTFTVQTAGGISRAIIMTVNGSNDAPVLTATKATLANGTEDTSYTITQASLLSGLSDVDGNSLSVINLTTANGTLSAFNTTTQSWTFTPTSNFNGTVNLNYNVTDGFTNTAATQSFSLAAVNDAPNLIQNNKAGKVITDFGAGSDTGLSVTTQVDGKILVSGTSGNHPNRSFALARYNSDGSLDASFGVEGKVITDFGVSSDWGNSVAVQADGKILVGGNSNGDFALVRYNGDGSLDASFDVDGKVTTDFGLSYESGAGVAVQADGKILVGGDSNGDLALARYNSDGSLDISFDVDGKVTTNFGVGYESGNDMAVQADGKILIAGESNGGFALARYNSNGSLDTSFDIDGKTTTDFANISASAYSVTVQPDGKILTAGEGWDGNAVNLTLVRYNSDGSLDNSFGSAGRVITNLGENFKYFEGGYSVTAQADGRILVSGGNGGETTSDFILVRYNSDGSLDNSFGTNGKVTTDFGTSRDSGESLTLQADGQILVAGFSDVAGNNDFALVRYNSNGTIDTSFNPTSTIYTENGSPVVLDGTIRVNDDELNTAESYNGSSIILARHGGKNIDDQFGGVNSLSLTGGNVILNNAINVGSFTQDNGSLVISFNGQATLARVNSVLQQLAYSNGSNTPPANVQIDWTFNDGNMGAQGLGGALSTANQITTVNIISVNDTPTLASPVAISYIDTVNDDTFVTKTGNLVAADVDIGTTLSYGISGGTDNGTTVSQVNAYGTLTVSKASGAYTFVPNDTAIEALKTNFSASFTVTVTDGVIATPVASTLTINLTGANDTAVFAGSLAGSVTEDGTRIATGTLTVTDHDPGDAAITAQTNTLGVYGNFSIASNGQWTYTLNNAASNVQSLKAGQSVTDTFTVNTAGGTTRAFGITINGSNDAPILTTAKATLANGTEDLVYTITQASLLTGFSDVDGNPLTVTGLTATNGSLSAFNATTQSWTFTPTANFNGTVNLSYNVTDGIANTVATQSFSVTAVNDAPVLSGTKATLTAGTEDIFYTITQASLLTGFSDADGNALSVTGLTATNGTLSTFNTTTQSWTFTPTTNFNGTVNLSYNVSDGVANTAATQNFSLAAVNDAPILATPAIVTYIDTAADDGFSNVTGTLAGDDVDSSSTLTYGISNGTDNGATISRLSAYGTLTVIKATGAYTLVPNDTAIEETKTNSSTGFFVTVTDGIIANPITKLLSLKITAVNDPTTFSGNLTGIVTEDTTQISIGTLTATDRDTGDAAITAQTNTVGTYGNFSIAGNGQWTYTLNNAAGNVQALKAGQTVTDIFTVNTAGGTKQAIGIVINGSNDAPVLTAAKATLSNGTEDNTYNITLASLLNGFTDVDGNALTVTGLIVSNGTLSTFNTTTQSWTFTPTGNFNGTVNLNYNVTDGVANTAATQSFSVTAVNDAPILTTAKATLGNGNEDTSYTITQASLLTGFTDVDGNVLTVSGLTATNGSLSAFNATTQSWTFTPTSNFNGTVNLSYNVTDGIANTAATQSFNLAAVNDAPVVSGTKATLVNGSEDTAYTITLTSLLTGFTDVDGNVLTVSGLTATNGSLSAFNTTTQSWTFTPTANFNGTVNLSYNVTDGIANTPATQSFNLAAVNDAPTLSAPLSISYTDTVNDDVFVTKTGNLAAADLDAGATLTYGIRGGTDNGAVVSQASVYGTLTVIKATGAYTFVPNDKAIESLKTNSSASFIVTVTDGVIATPIASRLTINLTGANDLTNFTGNLAANLTEDGTQIATGRITANDRDQGDADIAEQTNTIGSYGNFIIASNGRWIYTLNNAANNVQSLNVDQSVTDTFTVNTAGGGSRSITFNLTGTNDAPILSTAKATLANGTEDSPYTITLASLLTGFSDVDGNTLTVTGLTATNGSLSAFNATTGSWTFTPTANFNGTVNLSYNVTDGIANTATTQSFSLAAVNDAPTLSAPLSISYTDTVNDDVFVTKTGNLAAADLDAGATLTYGIRGGTDNGAVVSQASVYGTLTVIKATGAYTFVPNDKAIESLKTNSSASFIVTVTDGMIATPIASTLSIDLFGINDPTSFSGAISADITEDVTQPATGSMTVSDRDTGDAVITAQADSIGSYGNFNIGANGVWNYTLRNADHNVQSLKADQTVTDTFTVATVDGASQTITISIQGSNDTPVLSSMQTPLITGAEDVAYIITLASLLNGFSDVDGNTLTVTGLTVTPATAQAGTLSAFNTTTQSWTFTPTANFNGTVNLSYNVTDGIANTAATQRFSLAAVNDAPTGNLNVIGTRTQGQMLSADATSLADADGLGALTYQWQSSSDGITWSNISSAVSVNYTLTASDAGKQVRLQAAYTDGSGNAELINSGAFSIGKLITGTSKNDTLTGKVNDDHIEGLAGNDIINGDAGADAMIGGLGNDTYYIDSIGDSVLENLNQGKDIVNSTISYTLGNHLEDLLLTGSAIYGTGNQLNNEISGNAVANILEGGFGKDSLYGYAGDDTLNGGDGADTMIGGLGDDQYYVDHANDAVKESANEGTDTVHSSVSYTLTANFENLILTGTNAINGTGNKLNNSIIGNMAVNKLNGGSGNDFIDGGLGNDILKGAAGNDTFSFSSQLSATNIDSISDFSSGTDHIGLDARVFTRLFNDTDLSDNIVVSAVGSNALDANDYLIYNTTTKALYYDADGSGAGAAVQFATLTNIATVRASDFVVM